MGPAGSGFWALQIGSDPPENVFIGIVQDSAMETVLNKYPHVPGSGGAWDGDETEGRRVHYITWKDESVTGVKKLGIYA